MEGRHAQVLDRGSPRNSVVGVKREQVESCDAIFSGPYCTGLVDMSTKRRRLDESGNKTSIQYYLNFKKSGKPERVLFFENGDWNDFSQDLLGAIQNDLEEKKAVIEVEFGDQCLVLDFVHMYRVDLKTGQRMPMAWIDVSGACFFPDVYPGDNDERHDCCHRYSGKDKEPSLKIPFGSGEIKLQFDIDIHGLEKSKVSLSERSGESNGIVNQQDQVTQKPAIKILVEVEKSGEDTIDARLTGPSEAVNQIKTDLAPKVKLLNEEFDSNAVKEIFRSGMKPLDTSVEIVNVTHCSSILLEAHLELFQKQMEITEKYRGDANVRYAWLPTRKSSLSTIMSYGLVGHDAQAIAPHGKCVKLIPADFSLFSSLFCDIDENEVQHMIFCRVIIGKIGLLGPGPKVHLSEEDYDTGVDNLHNPTRYLVWHMNMGTHIHPEYIVSYKLPEKVNQIPANVSEITTADVQRKARPSCSGESVNSHTPSSPWMPFPMLFAAISNSVPPISMRCIDHHYQLFRSKRITRDDFIRKLRSLVGDNILRSSIITLQNKRRAMPKQGASKPNTESALPE